MTPSKRFLDLVVAIVLAIVLAPALLVVGIVILALDGRPVMYLSERMRTPERSFQLVKFRTMKPDEADTGVSGADKASRITRTGRFLRRTRIDELPQLWNVLRGDLSLVGPRPPLRQYVERFPALYAEVLRSHPGVTGLASLKYHRHEELLLGRSRSSAETDVIYCRSCVPRKARFDMIYQRRRSLCWDLVLIAQTVLRRSR